MATLDQVLQQFRANGMPDLPPGHPRLNTNSIVRYGPKKRAFYRLYEFASRTGTRHIVGMFGIWGQLEPTKIETDWKGIDPAEHERIKATLAEQEKQEQQKRAARANFAATRARTQWNDGRSLPPEGVQTYLERKGVLAERGLRYALDGTLLVPAIRYDITDEQAQDPAYHGPRRLVGLQKIAPDGTKLFNKGMLKDGAACRLGKAPRSGQPILVAEGVATGLSIRQALVGSHPVFVAFDAGNLVPVARILRKLYPKSPIIFCADDDAYLESSMNKLLREAYDVSELVPLPVVEKGFNSKNGPLLISADWTEDGDGVQGIAGAVRNGERMNTFSRMNAGRVYAHRAASEVGNAAVIYPKFADRKLPADPDVSKLTDFNDLHQVEGLEVVRAQVSAELQRYELAAAAAELLKSQQNESKKKGKKGGGEPPKAEDFDWPGFYERFTLIYPTDTVWDAQKGVIAKLSALKIHFGEAIIRWWLQSDKRRTVDQENVVFDPTETVDPKTHINLYRGFATKPAEPSEGSCEKLIELLQYLCGEAGQDIAPVTDWVLKWLAYPLQHPGAKMATALVVHGPAEGTGKNLFFGTVRAIYGRYGALITQSELESPYNSWISQRLFMIANEVISRQEMRHHVGRLKNLVTESPIPIQEKYLPMRYEVNHMNMVFLTNELQALQIGEGDRRYMVIRTPGVHAPKFYEEVVAEIAAGGAAALHRYLLDLDCGDFNEHTKPLLTAAKEDLIDMGRDPVQQFWHELHEGLLNPLMYGPCLSTDLYDVFVVWCVRNGIKNPAPSTKFSHGFMAMNGVTRRVERVFDPDKPSADKRIQRTVFLMGDGTKLEASAELDDAVKSFREAAREWVKDSGVRSRPAAGKQEGSGDGATH